MVRNACLLIILWSCGVWEVKAESTPSCRPQVHYLTLAGADSLALPRTKNQRSFCPPDKDLERERATKEILLNVEVAYWNLHGAHCMLHSRKASLHRAYKTLNLIRARREAGLVTDADVAQARCQCDLFRRQKSQAAETRKVLEGQLLVLLNLPIEDRQHLVPIDVPAVTPMELDWQTVLDQTLQNQPVLKLARQELQRTRERLLAAKQFRTIIDSKPGATAIQTVVDELFPERAEERWEFRIRGVPPQFITYPWPVSIAREDLARSMESLKNQEWITERTLAQHYRQVVMNYEALRIQQAELIACAKQLQLRQREFDAGGGKLDALLEAQRCWADVKAREVAAITNYNNAKAGFALSREAALSQYKISLESNRKE